MRIVTMALAPPAAIRWSDYIVREICGPYHYLAVARAACSDDEARLLVSRELRALMFPTTSEGDECVAGSWVRTHWKTALTVWASREFGDIAALVNAPAKLNQQCSSYCPRCCEQYVPGHSYCADCPGVALKAFEEKSATPHIATHA
jgi:hypothetical protein